MPIANIVSTTLTRNFVTPSMRDTPSLEGADIRIANRHRIVRDPNQDTILLLGHADTADGVYEPFEVQNVQDTINYLGGDQATPTFQESPLVRGFLQLIDAGCQNIFLYPVAPMSEYVDSVNLLARLEKHPEWDDAIPGEPSRTVEDNGELFPTIFVNSLSWGSNDFYERYWNRLAVAYSRLFNWGYMEGIELIVPVEAPFFYTGFDGDISQINYNDAPLVYQDMFLVLGPTGVDFATQLADFCYSYFTTYGNVCLGVLGTRLELINDATINEIISDPRLDPAQMVNQELGKMVMVVLGEGIISHRDTSLTYNSSLEVQAAINLAQTDLARSISGTKLRGVINTSRGNLTPAQASLLAKHKVNPVVRTKKGLRGFAFETKILTDNTLSEFPDEKMGLDQDYGTNFWSMSQMHLIGAIINQIKQYGQELVGQTFNEIELFRTAVIDYMNSLRNNNYVRDYALNFELVPEQYTVNVALGITPSFNLRKLYFQVEVGPSHA